MWETWGDVSKRRELKRKADGDAQGEDDLDVHGVIDSGPSNLSTKRKDEAQDVGEVGSTQYPHLEEKDDIYDK